MPQYVVQLQGGGSMTVNASDPQAAMENAAQGGNTPVGSASQTTASPNALTSGIDYTAPSMPGAPENNTTYTNLTQYNQEYQNAYTAAQTAYLQSKMRLEGDDLAFRKAQQAFSESLSRAQMLGTFEGQPTMASAALSGLWQGAPTQAAQKQAADLAAQQAGLTGMYQAPSGYAPGTYVRDPETGEVRLVGPGGQTSYITNPSLIPPGTNMVSVPGLTAAGGGVVGATGQQTLPAQQQYWSQAFQQQVQQQKVTQDYLNLLSTLRGPQDYGQYLRTMASTPQGLRDLVNAAAGQQGAAFGTTGVPTQGVTLPGFMAQAGGAPGAPGQAPVGGTSYEEYMRAAQNLPPPSQIAPQNWNAMTDSQKKMLLAMYESTGWNVTDAQQQYAASLPKFGSTSPEVGQTRLV